MKLHGFLFPRNGRYFSMNNITTQKLALGVLMALVLVFGGAEHRRRWSRVQDYEQLQ